MFVCYSISNSIFRIIMSTDNLYGDLKRLYSDPLGNAAEINRLNAELKRILEEDERKKRSSQEKEESAEKGKQKEYSPEEGIYRTPSEKKEHDAYKERTKGKPAFEQAIDEKTGKTSTRSARSLDKFEESCLREKITNKEWYSNIQAKHLTGQEVPAGKDELHAFLKSKATFIEAGNSLSFSYLITDKDSSKNHFVSMTVSQKNGRLELLYLDSNGETIRPNELAAVKKALPGITNQDVKYIDGVALANGQLNKLSEAEATKNPERVLRVQFDGHNCGMYSTESTRMMTAANGNEQDIVRGLTAIKNINPSMQRGMHMSDMGKIVDGQTIDRNAAYRPKTLKDISEEANIPRETTKRFSNDEESTSRRMSPNKPLNQGPSPTRF
jgi:hypothetical protein